MKIRSTTILAVRKNGQVAIGGDGQVTLQNTVMKSHANKIRTMDNGKVVAGFAGSTADALTLFGKFEEKLKEFRGNIERAAVELSKEWRSDRFLRKLEALLIVGNKEGLFILSGTGDVIEPDDGIAAIGSGGPYALAAARVLSRHTKFSVRQVVEESLKVAGEICIYTNNNQVIEEAK